MNGLDDSVGDPEPSLYDIPDTPDDIEGLDLDYDDLYKLAPSLMDQYRSTDGTPAEIAQTVSGLAQTTPEYIPVRDTASNATFQTVKLTANAASVKVAGATPNRRRVVVSGNGVELFISDRPIPAPYDPTKPGDYIVVFMFETFATDVDLYVGCQFDVLVSILTEYY